MAPEPQHELTRLEVGRIAFSRAGDKRIAEDGRACASCHPDGRDDGLTWSGPDGARQTPMLAGRLGDTAPYGWSGASATVEEHIKKTFQRLGGSGLASPTRAALAGYIEVMHAPAPASKADAQIERGREVFASTKAGCASCHVPGYGFTDGEQHDVGSLNRSDRVAALDTPSLRYVSGTAPYFHDGRYANLRELLRETDGAMGTTRHLPPADLDALVAYLQSL
jgi:cytochrome c peroxidase